MKLAHGVISAAKTIWVIGVITFVVQALVLALQVYLDYMQVPVYLILLDAVLLSVLISGAVYWLVLSPIKREYEELLRVEARSGDIGGVDIKDLLTDTLNRRGVTIDLLEAMAYAERYGNSLSIALVDIDDFKHINGTHGQEVGDKVLQDVAGVLSDTLRMPDRLGRYGGEEFLLVLPQTKLDDGCKIADRIRDTVSKTPLEIGTKKINITISIGVAQFRQGDDLEQLLSRAEKAIDEAAKKGGNLVVGKKDR